MASVFYDMVKDIGKAIDSALEDIDTPESVYKNDLHQECKEARLNGMRAVLVWVKDMLECDCPQDFEAVANRLWGGA